MPMLCSVQDHEGRVVAMGVPLCHPTCNLYHNASSMGPYSILMAMGWYPGSPW
jgi:hypothetical protein